VANAANLQCLFEEILLHYMTTGCTMHGHQEASKHSDSSNLLSLSSALPSINTMGSAESDGISPKPSVVFAITEMQKYHQVELPSEIDCTGAVNEIPAANAPPSLNTGGHTPAMAA
jgi:hypothetical protein